MSRFTTELRRAGGRRGAQLVWKLGIAVGTITAILSGPAGEAEAQSLRGTRIQAVSTQPAPDSQPTPPTEPQPQPQPDSDEIPLVNLPSKPCPSLEELGYEFKQLMDIRPRAYLENVEVPEDCSVGIFDSAVSADAYRRSPADFYMWWAASEIRHHPLYFEDAVLERYGQSYAPWLQPAVSGAHFFGNLMLYPYKAVVNSPFSWEYNLGYYRPGSPMPCVARRLPRPW